MNANELRDKSDQELRDILHEMLKEQFNLRMHQGTEQVARHHMIRQVRKNIAKVKTVMTEQRRAG